MPNIFLVFHSTKGLLNKLEKYEKLVNVGYNAFVIAYVYGRVLRHHHEISKIARMVSAMTYEQIPEISFFYCFNC